MARGGFIIPNSDVNAPLLQPSQPDQGDFVILGNSQFGVITGCAATKTTAQSVTLASGTNVLCINGHVLKVTGGVTLSVKGNGTTLPRFDLAVYDNTDGFSLVVGTPDANPTFPEITTTMVVLAAILVPESGGDIVVTDKRNFVQTNMASVDSAWDLLTNYASDGSSIKVTVEPSGMIKWGSGTGSTDTSIARTAAGKLTISNEVIADVVTANTSLTVGGKSVVTSGKISWGTSTSGSFPSPEVGNIFVSTDTGTISVKQVAGWVPIETKMPTGSVIMSFASQLVGWLKLDGQTYSVADSGGLAAAFPDWVNGDGNVVLPDMSGRFPLGTDVSPNIARGLTDSLNTGSMTQQLTTTHMPAHVHQTNLVSGTTSSAEGGHDHTAAAVPAHSHTISDTGHAHGVTDNGHYHFSNRQGLPIYAANLESTAKIPFLPGGSADNIWVGTAANETSIAATGVSVNSGNSNVSSAPGGAHTPTINTGGGTHTHTIPAHESRGGDTAFTITPPSMSIYYYIKM